MATEELWYGCRNATSEYFAMQLRKAGDDALGRWIKKHGGIDNFKLRVIATYAKQLPAIAHANKLIVEAMDQNRAINPGPLSVSNKRNAPI
jgi:predicted aminopeptidase